MTTNPSDDFISQAVNDSIEARRYSPGEVAERPWEGEVCRCEADESEVLDG